MSWIPGAADGSEKSGRAPLSRSQLRKKRRGKNQQGIKQKNYPCFPFNHFPLRLGSHDTGGSVAVCLTPPAVVDVDHHDVTPAGSSLYNHQQKHGAASEIKRIKHFHRKRKSISATEEKKSRIMRDKSEFRL